MPDRTAAFQSILHWRGGYYRPHEAPPPGVEVRLIVEAGGVPVIAHPGTRGPDRLFAGRRIREIVDAGFFGIEVGRRDTDAATRETLDRDRRAVRLS